MPPFTPLLRPRRYFASRPTHLPKVLAVVGLLLFTGPLTVYGVGWVLTGAVDGTVTVDNPNRPPDWVCEDRSDGDSAFDCDEPAQLERDVDAVIWDVMGEFAGPAVAVYPVVLLVLTLLLHAGVWLVDADGSWFTTATVATWGLLPAVLVVAGLVVALRYSVDPVTVAPGDDVGAALAPLEAQLRAVRPYRTAGTVIASVWGAAIWRGGLIERHGLRAVEATVLAGLVAALDAGVAVALG